MKFIEEVVDERQKAWCIHCATPLAVGAASKDHVPTKSLLLRPLPSHLPAVSVCRTCNAGFSLDEQYVVAFLSCVVSGSSDPVRQINPSAARALTSSPGLRADIERSRFKNTTGSGEERTLWEPDIPRIERIVVKNARGHVFFEWGEPVLGEPVRTTLTPLECMRLDARREFEGQSQSGRELAGWPEVGSRTMTRLLTGVDMLDGWIVVQKNVYRYSILQTEGGLIVRSVVWEYLATETVWEN